MILLLVSVASLTLNSCNSDDEAATNEPVQLENTWSLVNVRGGFSGTNKSFAKGKILWTFRTDGSVIVANNDAAATPYMPFENGNYPYAITVNPNTTDYCKESMTINDLFPSFCYNIDDSNQLVLDANYVDGFKYTFVEN